MSERNRVLYAKNKGLLRSAYHRSKEPCGCGALVSALNPGHVTSVRHRDWMHDLAIMYGVEPEWPLSEREKMRRAARQRE
jgi:hypothetical protein